MKGKIGFILLVLFSLLLVNARAVDVDLTSVKLNGDYLYPHSYDFEYFNTFRLDINKEDTLNLKVYMYAYNDSDNLQVTAFLTGYEYSDFESVSASTHVFAVKKGIRYIKKLSLNLPKLMETGKYKLRVLVSDRDSKPIEEDYDIYIDTSRHNIVVKDIVFNPETAVKAGKALLTTVRIKNVGQKTEEGIRIKVSIPELDISASDYVEKLEPEESTSSEELYLRIPETAKTKDYNVVVTLKYDEYHEQKEAESKIHVIAKPNKTCEKDECNKPKLVLGVTQDTLTAENNKQIVYPLMLTNAGQSSATYVIELSGLNDIAKSTINPTNVVVLKSGETKMIYIYVTPKNDTKAGNYLFVTTIKKNNEAIKQIPLKLRVKVNKCRTKLSNICY